MKWEDRGLGIKDTLHAKTDQPTLVQKLLGVSLTLKEAYYHVMWLNLLRENENGNIKMNYLVHIRFRL